MRTREDMTILEARALGRRLFGDRFNGFVQGGLWYVGRFLVDPPRPAAPGQPPPPPYGVPQEIFGCGVTLREAFSFLGPERAYSIPGISPGITRLPAYRPVLDAQNNIVGWKSRAGVFTRGRFPGRALAQA